MWLRQRPYMLALIAITALLMAACGAPAPGSGLGGGSPTAPAAGGAPVGPGGAAALSERNSNTNTNLTAASDGYPAPGTEPTAAPAPGGGTTGMPSLDFTGPCNALPVSDPSPQREIGHPSIYLETGTGQTGVPANDPRSGTQCYEGDVHQGFILLMGGEEIDGVDKGLYRAIAGPTHVHTVIHNGFIAIVVPEWGVPEFQFRIDQTNEMGWANCHIMPLDAWSATISPKDCDGQLKQGRLRTQLNGATASNNLSGASAPAMAPAALQSAPAADQTGQVVGTANNPDGSDSWPLQVGQSAFGSAIDFKDGTKCGQPANNGCYVLNSTAAGTVHGGVVGRAPSQGEVDNQQLAFDTKHSGQH